MKYTCSIIAALLPSAAGAANVSLAPFASSNCPGLTYQLNGTQGWNYGGTNDLSTGNGQFASYQSSRPTSAVAPTGRGMSVGVVQSNGQLNGAMLNTHGQFFQQYGYFEMTAELTEGALQPGMTTAFWLMSELGGWPPEIDIQETSGNTGDTAVHAHSGTSGISYQYNMGPGMHVWATNWTKDTITFYIDAKQVAQTTTPDDFHVPMYMVLDAMSQGSTGTMNVQSIRVFKDMESAMACVQSAAPMVANAIFDQSQEQASMPSSEQLQAQVSPSTIAQYSVPSPSLPNLTDPSAIAAEIAATEQQIQQTENALASLPARITQSRSQATTSATELTAPAQPPSAPTSNKRHEDDDNDADDQ